MARESVLAYFAAKADRYDDVDSQAYWRLSDALLWEALTEDVIPRVEADEPRLLDAGGGTGRWTLRTLDEYPEMTATLFDVSKAMLDEARAKVDGDELGRRLDLVRGDLHDVDYALDATYDLVYCFHNVLGFVADPAAVVENLAALLAPGGRLVCFVPNRYHGVYFNVKTGRVDVAERIATVGRGTFTDEMPDMSFFTPSGLRETFEAAGLDDVAARGLPVGIYPGYEETQIEGNTRSIAGLLSDDETFARVFEMERRLDREPEAAARGNNLLVVGRNRAGRRRP